MSIWLYALIFFFFIAAVQITGHYRGHIINTESHCTYLAQILKKDISYGNEKSLQDYFDNKKNYKLSPVFENIGLVHWHAIDGNNIIAEDIKHSHTFVDRFLEVDKTCEVDDIRNTNYNSQYKLSITTEFKLEQSQLFWVVLTSLFLAGLPLLIYARVTWERDVEKNEVLNFFSQITQREHRKLSAKTLSAKNIIKILENESNSIIRFIDETRELNDRIDPEYINRLEKNFIDLEERSAHLAIKNKELSRQTTLKSSFFANLSHDFRTPLYTIDGYSRFLLGTQLDRKQLSHVNAIQTANANLLELVSNFLSLSRLEAGKIDLDYSQLDLRKLIEEIITGLSFLTTEHQNHFFVDISDDLPSLIETDAIKLRQILANLISNAVKYTHDGIIYIRISTRKISNDNISVTLSIADTGKGISEANLETIFDPYTRLIRDKTQIHGTGLGLGICKELCEVIGAKLSVESRVGYGSTFTVDFNSKIIRTKDETQYKYMPLGHELYVYNSIADFEVYIQEWLRPLDVKVHDIEYKRLLDPDHVKSIPSNAKILILMDYNEVDSIPKWTTMLKDFNKNVIVYVAMDYLSFEQMQYLDPFVVVNNNLSNYALSDSISRKGSPFTNLVEQFSEEPLKGYVLLLAEDNDLNRRIIEERLTTFGAQVISCPDGSAALELYKARKYSAILMDAHMPKISGTELTEMIRRVFSDHSTPIIGITASTSTVEYQHFIQSGMTDCLIKPLQDKQLIETIIKFAQPLKDENIDALGKSGEYKKLSIEQTTQERINELSISSIQKHLLEIEKIMLMDNTVEKQSKLFHEMHKLNGTLSMTSFNKLQKSIRDIEAMINPVLWSTTDHSVTSIIEKIIKAEERFIKILPDLEEKSSNREINQ